MSESTQSKGTGAHGFAFEELIGRALGHLRLGLEAADSAWIMHIKNELQIRAYFQEPSLNGVDHMVQVEDPSGVQHLFLIQEKWKLVTKQNEVSQFLDCCARILARMPDYKGKIHRLWVSRTVPSANGEKSLLEGQAILVQCCTSQSLLAYMTVLIVCEVLGVREEAEGILAKMGSLLPSKEDGILPEVEEANMADLTFQPVSNFGEKRVLKVTKDTVVRVVKGE